MWVFGYGSLIWKPGFPFAAKRFGAIRGWKRRFWQGSTDHRGVPGSPGRVVTLLRDPTAETFGVAYEIAVSRRDEVLAQLDYREKGGYERFFADVYQGTDIVVADALVYVATPDNPEYLGPANLGDMADQIASARGPSGANREYLFELERALNDLDASDAHVMELARAVRSLG